MQITVHAPRGKPSLLWSNDLDGFGSQNGLGCSSDGTSVICSICAEDYGLIAFDFFGNFLWKTEKVNGSDGSCNFVSIALGNGGAFVRDNSHISFINKTGAAIWSNPYEAKFEPTNAENGRLIFGTTRGGMFELTPQGNGIGAIEFPYTYNNQDGKFFIVSTPSINRNRIYATASFVPQNASYDVTLSALFAVDIHVTQVNRFNISWEFFTEDTPIGNPLSHSIYSQDEDIVLFIGEKYLYALKDDKWSYTLLWKLNNSNSFNGIVQDPNDNAFFYSQGTSDLLLQVSEKTGEILSQVKISNLLCGNQCSQNFVITSIVNIAGPSSEPVILCAVSSGNGNSTVVAIDLYDLVLLWSFEVESEVNGQFVVMNQPTKKQVVFSTKNNGIIAIGGHS